MNFKTKNPNSDNQKLQQLLEQVNFLSQEKKILEDENQNLILKMKIKNQNYLEKEEQLQKELSIAQLQISKNSNNQNCDLDETVLVKNKRYVGKEVASSEKKISFEISSSMTYLKKIRPVKHISESVENQLFKKKQSFPCYISDKTLKSQVSYSNIKKKKDSTKKKKRNKSANIVNVQIKQENSIIKKKADKAAKNFIKNLDRKINEKKRNESKNKLSSKEKLKDSIFSIKPNLNMNKDKSKNMKKMIKSSTIDFKQILNNFSLSHKHKDLKPKLGDISLSTINHSLNHDSQKHFFKKSVHTNFNNSIDPNSSSINMIFNKPITKVDKAVMTDKVNFAQEKDISGSSLNSDEMQENIPKKFEKLYSKLYSQIKKINKKNSNLERQLRNRNKDYIYALKEIENIKSINTD